MTISFDPLPGALTGVQIKFDRAYEHITALQEAVAPVLDRDAYRLDPVPDPHDPRTISYQVGHLEPVSPGWSAIVGDALTNLRACLDHLARQLYLLEGGQGPAKTQFPVMGTPRADGCPPRLGDHLVTDATFQQKLIEVQPYSSPDPPGHQLAVLNRLVNRDKHESLVLTEGLLESASWGIGLDAQSPQVAVHRGPIVTGTVLARFTFPADVPPTFRPDFDLHLYFEEPALRSRPVLAWLTVIQDYVASVVRRFLPLF